MAKIEITGIRKPDGDETLEAISHYLWVDHSNNDSALSQRMVIVNWLKQNTGNSAYVKNSQGKIAYCDVRSKGNTEFLQTYSDGQWNNNLLSLPRV